MVFCKPFSPAFSSTNGSRGTYYKSSWFQSGILLIQGNVASGYIEGLGLLYCIEQQAPN